MDKLKKMLLDLKTQKEEGKIKEAEYYRSLHFVFECFLNMASRKDLLELSEKLIS